MISMIKSIIRAHLKFGHLNLSIVYFAFMRKMKKVVRDLQKQRQIKD